MLSENRVKSNTNKNIIKYNNKICDNPTQKSYLTADHLNKILTNKTPTNKIKTNYNAVRVLKFIHNIISKKYNSISICYESVAKKLSVCAKTISRAIEYLKEKLLITVKKKTMKICDQFKTEATVSINYDILQSEYDKNNIKFKIHKPFSQDIGANLCTNLNNTNYLKYHHNKDNCFSHIGGQKSPSNYINNNINNRLSICNNEKSEKNYVKNNYQKTPIIISQNTSQKSNEISPKPATKKTIRKPLIEFLPQEKSIFEAFIATNTTTNTLNISEITFEEFQNILNNLINKYNLKFNSIKAVVSYISKAIKSKQSKCNEDINAFNSQDWISKKSITDIVLTEEHVQKINQISNRNFNITGANRILEKLKSNKYANREFNNEKALIFYMSKVFKHEKGCEDYINKTKEEQELVKKIEEIKNSPARSDKEVIIKRLSNTLKTDTMCKLISESKVEYDRQTKTCYILIKDNYKSTIQNNEEMKEDINKALISILESSFRSDGSNKLFNVEFKAQEKEKQYKIKEIRPSEYLIESGEYKEDEEVTKQILDHIKSAMQDDDKFFSWMDQLKVIKSEDESRINIYADSKFAFNWINNNYIHFIQNAYESIIGDKYIAKVKQNCYIYKNKS